MASMRQSTMFVLTLLLTLSALAIAIDVPTRTRDPDGFQAPTVALKHGAIEGTRAILPSSEAIVDQFLGVPFAVSPPERFSPPQPAKKRSKLYDAKRTKPACIQQFAYPAPNHEINQHIFNDPPSEESEDCLYLNVFRPQTTGVGKAVLFWLYPGGLQFGDASRSIYNGSNLAAFHNVIVVAPNFRSNVFGFPNSDEIDLDKQNLGFLDQRLALKWVQENIVDFGGNPARVVLFGNSAGGTSIDRLITTMPIDPPFQAAIIQSGQASYAPYQAMNGKQSWKILVEYFGCGKSKSALRCMRSKSPKKIKDFIEKTAILFTPVTDNVTQLSATDAQKVRAARTIANVPVLIGSNGQEGSAFWRHDPEGLEGFLDVFFAGKSDVKELVRHLYPLDSVYDSQYARLSAIFTDLVFTCPTALWANASAAAGMPTWRYFYNASFPAITPAPRLGAYHTGELPLVFGTYPEANGSADVYSMSKFMQQTWASFAKNPYGGPGWPKLGLFGGSDVGFIDETSSGVSVTASSVVDSKCWALRHVYEDLNTPPFAF